MKNLLLILWSCGLSLAAFAQSVSEPIDLEIPAGTIHGTLLLPQAATSVPVVLMIAGSGPTDRDGNTVGLLGKNDSLLLLAQALAEHGIASLRYDKRGIAASREAGPSDADLRFENYAEDASAWLDLLAQDSRFSTRYLLGHSEGSLLGMLALRTHPEVAFISIAGPAD
ncbi:MAG: lysophospholipase, partial [Pseudomonadales bacterium]|nr:lysophospholipase [Pseudomonadales bacterium]